MHFYGKSHSLYISIVKSLSMHIYSITDTWEWYKEVHAFPKGISPKVNVIARLVLELAYWDITFQCVSHYAMEIPSYSFK